MKKIITSLALIFSGIYLSAQIPNPSFENWTNGNPDGWVDANLPPTYINVTQSNQAHAGSSAVKLGVYTSSSTNYGGFVETSFHATAVSESDSLTGWYKSNLLTSGDQFFVFYIMYSGGNEVAFNEAYYPGSYSTYTRFAVAVIPFITASIDSVSINLSIDNQTSSPLNVNSYVIVDDLQIGNSPAGIHEEQNPTALSVFPNPTNSLVNFTVAEKSTVELYAVDGTLLLSKTVEAGNQQLDLADLPEGMMMLVVRNDNQLFRQQIMHQR